MKGILKFIFMPLKSITRTKISTHAIELFAKNARTMICLTKSSLKQKSLSVAFVWEYVVAVDVSTTKIW